MARRGRRRAGQEQPQGSRGPRARRPSGCWTRRPTRASRSARSTPSSTRCPSRRCPAVAVRARRRRAARRQVRLEGRRGVSRPWTGFGGRRKRCGAVGADRGRQRAGAAGRAQRARARTNSTGCSRVCSSNWSRWCSMRAPTSPPPPTRCWRWSTDLDDEQRARLVGRSRRRPADRAAERSRGAVGRRGRGHRRQDHRLRRRRARDHRRRPGIPQPRRRARRGSWPARSPPVSATCGCSPKAASRRRMRCGRSVSGSPPTTTSS